MLKKILKISIVVIPILIVGAIFWLSSKGASTSSSIDVSEERKQDEITPSTPKASKSNTLDLSGQGLSKLPSDVLSKTSLEVLNISNNALTGALPAEIRHLRNLKVLDASNNKMTGVPAEVGQLEKLEVLDLSNNQLTGLPYELGNLKNLKTLNLSGNNYAQQDLDIIKRGLPSNVQIIL